MFLIWGGNANIRHLLVAKYLIKQNLVGRKQEGSALFCISSEILGPRLFHWLLLIAFQMKLIRQQGLHRSVGGIAAVLYNWTKDKCRLIGRYCLAFSQSNNC